MAPQLIDSPSHRVEERTANTQTTLNTQKTITVTDKRNPDLELIIKVKPFSGKVTYY